MYELCACGELAINDTGQCEECFSYAEMYEEDALSYQVTQDVYYNICDR